MHRASLGQEVRLYVHDDGEHIVDNDTDVNAELRFEELDVLKDQEKRLQNLTSVQTKISVNLHPDISG